VPCWPLLAACGCVTWLSDLRYATGTDGRYGMVQDCVIRKNRRWRQYSQIMHSDYCVCKGCVAGSEAICAAMRATASAAVVSLAVTGRVCIMLATAPAAVVSLAFMGRLGPCWPLQEQLCRWTL
jgi:hypothetical protein